MKRIALFTSIDCYLRSKRHCDFGDRIHRWTITWFVRVVSLLLFLELPLSSTPFFGQRSFRYRKLLIWFGDYHAVIPITIAKVVWSERLLFLLVVTMPRDFPEYSYGVFASKFRKRLVSYVYNQADLILTGCRSAGRKYSRHRSPRLTTTNESVGVWLR